MVPSPSDPSVALAADEPELEELLRVDELVRALRLVAAAKELVVELPAVLATVDPPLELPVETLGVLLEELLPAFD